MVGDQIEWIFDSGTTYTGTINANFDQITGTMLDFDSILQGVSQPLWARDLLILTGLVMGTTVASSTEVMNDEQLEIDFSE